ncbi:tryptophan-rich antigen [Plasmodium vivax]|uniref:Tryptophan-rich antigen n=1 Tax=Plasmodium vivax TaxID=5855 RepID=A0A1G4ECT3_PLAVI|nr:tryptophan-rich antigen [Plasmodium vivax]
MESSTYSESDVSEDNTSILRENMKEDKPSHAKGSGLSSVFSTFFAFLTSTAALLNTCSLPSLIDKYDAVAKPACLVGLVEEGPGEEEEWKRYTWDNWKTRLEEDFNEFYFSLDKEKKEWIEEKEGEWEKLIHEMGNKWTTPEKGFDNRAHLSDSLEGSSTWNDSQWEDWIRTKGSQLMEIEWENWINEKDSLFNEMILKKWIQWKNSKIMSWVTSEWKTEEDYYWANWEKNMTCKCLHLGEKTKWLKWKERTSRESAEWTDWVNNKECVYIRKVWNKWTEWKNNKKTLFKIWKDLFIDKWVDKKQWLAWTLK